MAAAAAAAAVPARVTVALHSFRGAQEVARAAATATAEWTVSIPRLGRLDDTPRVLHLLVPLRYPAPPRAAWIITPMRRLRAAASVSVTLAAIRTPAAFLVRNIRSRLHYRALHELGISIRTIARRLPVPARAVYRNLGNRVRRIACRAIRSGGVPARSTRHHLRGLSARAARLQAEEVELT